MCVGLVILALALINFALVIARNLTASLRDRWATKPALRALVVLRSGGHTAEMLALLDALDARKYAPRVYVVANTDDKSEAKALAFERRVRGGGATTTTGVDVHRVRRSREVGQSWMTSAASTASACVDAVRVIHRTKPDIILCNGPGTCVPIVIAGMVSRAMGSATPAMVFVESACRARALSLTGKIFYHFRLVDVVCVAWERMVEAYPRAVFVGRAM